MRRAGEDYTDQYTQIWDEYEKGLEYLNSIGLFSRVEKCHQMVNGDQWHGLKSGNDRPCQLNILMPIMKNSTALVGQNTLTIHYSPMDYGPDRPRMLEICDHLNDHAARTWERLKLERYRWDILQDAFIGGDSYAYFYDKDGQIAMDMIDNTCIMFADEQNPDIQEQPYLLVVQRRYVEDVKREAQENGIEEEEIRRICADDDTDLQINGKVEVNNDKKLTSIMKLWKQDGYVHIARSTKTVIYQPDTKIEGMTLYPIAGYSWKPKKGSARGEGDVWDKIPNQISINKNLYRFESAVKTSAFPHKVYKAGALADDDVRNLAYPDSNIEVNDPMGQGIANVIAYLQPASISPYAKDIWQEIISITRDLAGAGDNLENIDPTQASGAAITAAREAKTLNVNMQVSAYSQWMEDVALIWYDMWVAYHPNGMDVVVSAENDNGSSTISDNIAPTDIALTDMGMGAPGPALGNGVPQDIINTEPPAQPMDYIVTIPAEDLQQLKIDVRIDVAQDDPYSKMARNLFLKELLQGQYITFEEYVDAIDDSGSLPKEQLKAIVEQRAAAQHQELQEQLAALAEENAQLRAVAQQGQVAQEGLAAVADAFNRGEYQRQRAREDQQYRGEEIRQARELASLAAGK